MALSLNQAAKSYHVAKTTVQTALKNGEISADKNDKGQWLIEPAEMDRWISSRPTNQSETTPENRNGTPEKTSKTSELELELAVLRERLTSTEAALRREREIVQDVTAQRDDLTAVVKEQASTMRLLTDQRDQQAEEPPAPAPEPWFKLGGLRLGGKAKAARG